MERLKNFFFKNTGNKQTIVKNTFWLGAGEMGSRLLKLVVFAYAARIIGVNEWGVFSYGLALMGVFSLFSDIGINAILQREAVRTQTLPEGYVSTALFIKVIISLASALLLWCVGIVLAPEATVSLLPLVALMLFIDSIREFGFVFNRATEHMENEAAIKIFSTILLAITVYGMLAQTAKAVSLMIAYIAAGIASLFLLLYVLREYYALFKQKIRRPLFKPIFTEAWPIGIAALFATILSSIDTLLLGVFKDTAAVGYYAAAQKPAQILILVPGLISIALLPLLSRTAHEDNETFRSVLGRIMLITTVGIAPLVIATILLARPIIMVLFGTAYAPAIPLLQIISVSVFAGIPSIFLSNALLAYRKQRLTLIFIIIGAATNIALSLILIPRLGMYGAAISYTLSQIISNTCIVIAARRIPALRFSFSISALQSDIRSFLLR